MIPSPFDNNIFLQATTHRARQSHSRNLITRQTYLSPLKANHSIEKLYGIRKERANFTNFGLLTLVAIATCTPTLQVRSHVDNQKFQKSVQVFF